MPVSLSGTMSSRGRKTHLTKEEYTMGSLFFQLVNIGSLVTLEWRHVFVERYWCFRPLFDAEYPFKPPSIYMITPNGRWVVHLKGFKYASGLSIDVSVLVYFCRFKTSTRLCLSISDYHPDSWNPAWSVSTILTGTLWIDKSWIMWH